MLILYIYWPRCRIGHLSRPWFLPVRNVKYFKTIILTPFLLSWSLFLSFSVLRSSKYLHIQNKIGIYSDVFKLNSEFHGFCLASSLWQLYLLLLQGFWFSKTKQITELDYPIFIWTTVLEKQNSHHHWFNYQSTKKCICSTDHSHPIF